MKSTIIVIIAAILIAVGVYGFLNATQNLQVTHVNIDFCKGNTCASLKLLQISDIHASKLIEPLLDKVVNVIIQERPDIIVITGDAVHSVDGVDVLMTFLSRWTDKFRGRVFAIFGNWELRSRLLDKMRDVYDRLGVTLLEDSAKMIHIKKLTVTMLGIEFCYEKYYCESKVRNVLARYMADIRHSDLLVVLVHEPCTGLIVDEVLDKLRVNTPCVILAGHTHGGQVRIGSFVLYLPPYSCNFVYGVYNLTRCVMFVSQGIGAIIPFRLGTNPEVAVVRVSLPSKT